jgi:3-ketoacyl-CoA synthase
MLLSLLLAARIACRDLLQRTGVSPAQIGVVVVNSSVFCPTPSLAAQLMNHLNLSPRTLHYNLGGMGCAGDRDRATIF